MGRTESGGDESGDILKLGRNEYGGIISFSVGFSGKAPVKQRLEWFEMI